MHRDYPNVPEYSAAHARYLDQLGMRLFRAGKLDKSEERHREAVAIETKLVKDHPEVVAYNLWLGLMERSLAHALAARGELKEARTRLESAVGRVDASWQKDPRLSGVRPFLGMAYRELSEVLTRSLEPALAAEARCKADEFGLRDRGGPRP